MACDCKSALLNIFEQYTDTPRQSHYDLIHACRTQLKASQIIWKAKHVSGHQDDYNAYNNLDRWEQLIVDMDALAKKHWQTISTTQRP
jgi:hypothetical protein